MTWVAVLVAGSVAVAATAQMLSGLGFALIASPLLIATLGHAEGAGLTLVMSLVLNAVVLTRSHQAVRWGDALGLLVPAAVLVAPTLLFATHLSSAAVSATAGVVILIAVALVSTGRRPRWVQGRAAAVAAGAASGILNVLAGTSGPPVALYVAARGWTPRVAAATLQAYALPLNLLTLAAVGLPTARTRSPRLDRCRPGHRHRDRLAAHRARQAVPRGRLHPVRGRRPYLAGAGALRRRRAGGPGPFPGEERRDG